MLPGAGDEYVLQVGAYQPDALPRRIHGLREKPVQRVRDTVRDQHPQARAQLRRRQDFRQHIELLADPARIVGFDLQYRGADGQYALFCLLLAAAHLGFLLWNWPPARLFMGDGGSVPTGFLMAGLALLGAVQGQLNPLCWLILLAPFVTDATGTLLWRMATRQPFTQPHRLHAYQRLSRHWGSHQAVDMLLLALNGLWLAPLAWAVEIWPKYGFLLVILAYLPLLAGMAKVRKLG